MREFYFDEDTQTYLAVPSFAYPTETELIKIFPEANEIIMRKINDWTRVKGKVFCKEILPIIQKIDAIQDGFTRWFWKEAYKQCFLPGRYKRAIDSLERLKRLKLIATKPEYASKTRDRERNKLIAKQFPIRSLYPFKKIKKVGDRYQALCPFHTEKTPSFVIYPNNCFHCFGCQAHGDAIAFIRLLKGCSFNEAVNSLAGVA